MHYIEIQDFITKGMSQKIEVEKFETGFFENRGTYSTQIISPHWGEGYSAPFYVLREPDKYSNEFLSRAIEYQKWAEKSSGDDFRTKIRLFPQVSLISKSESGRRILDFFDVYVSAFEINTPSDFQKNNRRPTTIKSPERISFKFSKSKNFLVAVESVTAT